MRAARSSPGSSSRGSRGSRSATSRSRRKFGYAGRLGCDGAGMTRPVRRVVAFAIVVLALLTAGCGGSSSSSSGGGTASSANTTTSGGKQIRVGLVTDIGGLNDRSFNHLNYLGLLRAQKELGVEGRVLE